MAFDKNPPPAAPPSDAPLNGDDLDRRLRGRFSAAMGGQSPWAALQAWEDWAFHLATSPARQAALWGRAAEAALGLWRFAGGPPGKANWPFQPEPADRRFRSPQWSQRPFDLFAEAQLAAEAQWRAATDGVRGVADHYARRVRFMGDFLLNSVAPVNFPLTNPEVVEAIRVSGGVNVLAGAGLLLDDWLRLAGGMGQSGYEAFRIGETVAATPGAVVFRNALMEVIQYTPTTATVRREPVLIVPAWIMKYYILDLTPADSLVRHLLDAGHTVFILSWRNPRGDLRETAFEDYRRDGVMAALDVVGQIVPDAKIHAVGYCLGGTVLAIAAAAMDRDGDRRLASLTLLAAQTDFEEAGDLMLFVDESQLAVLEDMMHVQGYLDTTQMAGAFNILRANELVFARFVERYWLGKPHAPTDLDAWLADPTRMPARMHSEYLRHLFLENSFARGAYQVNGRAVAVKDIRTPIFALGAERDHIAPWRSVYKIELYSSGETTFVLTGGGHNTSVISPPGKPGAYYRLSKSDPGAAYVDPELWLYNAEQLDGSWWPVWTAWLAERSSSAHVAPPAMGGALEPAPGRYVLER